METLRAFRFTKRDSPLDRLDPRTRFAIAIVVAVLSLLTLSLPHLLLLFGVVTALAFWGKRGRLLLGGLRGVLPLAVMIFLLNWLTSVHEGIYTPLAMTLRFFVLTSAFSLFFLTTPPDELALALEEMRVPRDYSLLITMSFRFVPTLAQDVQIVIDALRSRGLELEKGGFRERVKNYVYLMVPLIVFEVRRSLMIAEALESRGFGAKVKPTRLVRLKMMRRDYATLALLLVFTLLFLASLGARA